MAASTKITMPASYEAASKALQAAFDEFEVATFSLRRASEYDPADFADWLERPPTDAEIVDALSVLDEFDGLLSLMRREHEEAEKGLRMLNAARLEARALEARDG